MPGQQNAIDARRRMEARLAAIRGGGGTGESLVDVMSVIGNAFSQVPDTSIEALSYRANVLDLRVSAKDTPSLERLRTLIGQSGYAAEFQSSTPRASGIEGRLQVKGHAPGGRG
jgi:type II secretory pathway component PulL